MDSNEAQEFKTVALRQAETFLKTFSTHFDYHRDTILDSLLDKPDRYLSEYCKMVNTVLSAFRNEEKVSVNINNNNYYAFFEEVASLSKKIDSNTHKLIKNNDNTYELSEIN